jgi:hypothetical protein
MTDAQILMLVGVPGSRKDFVLGWLSCLPKFLDIGWRVEMSTGKSFCTSITKNLEFPGVNFSNIKDYYQKYAQINLCSGAEYYYPSAAHGYNFFDRVDVQPYLNNKSVSLYYLNIDHADKQIIKWECYAKNYLVIETRKAERNQHMVNIDIDKVIMRNRNIALSKITDEMRIDEFQSILKHATNDEPKKFKQEFSGGYIELDYAQLFQETGGSRYLCNVLGITAEDRMHKYWDFMLPYIQTPDTIIRWGKIWNRHELTFN